MEINLSKLPEYFGHTEFDEINDIVRIHCDEKYYYEEKIIASIHIEEGQLIKRNSKILDIVKRGEEYYLQAKSKFYPIYQSLDCSLNIKKIYDESRTKKNINETEFTIIDRLIDCSLRINAVKRYSDINSWESPTTEKIEKSIDFAKHKVLSLVVVDKSILEGVRNLLAQYVENTIIGFDNLYEIIFENGEIFIFPKVVDSDGFIDSFKSHIDNFINYLKEYCFDQFYNCICEDGCFNCIYDTRFDHRGNENLKKNLLFLFFAELRKEEGVEEVIKIRSSKEIIATNRFKEIITTWQKIVLDILKQRANFTIHNIFHIINGDLDPKILGLCDLNNNIIIINNSLSPLNLIVEVISHEYTHNWQSENMHTSLQTKDIPFDGKLFIEGFAQWVAFKMMDYWGIMNNMMEITLRGIDSQNPDEYGLGFRLCRYIEENYGGFYGVINFITEGQIIDPINGNVITKYEIIKESNLLTYLL